MAFQIPLVLKRVDHPASEIPQCHLLDAGCIITHDMYHTSYCPSHCPHIKASKDSLKSCLLWGLADDSHKCKSYSEYTENVNNNSFSGHIKFIVCQICSINI